MKMKMKMKLEGMMTETTDPWKDLKPPIQTSSVSGRRVDKDLNWGLYWAVDIDGGCLLILRHAPENRPQNKLPKLRGLEIETRQPQGGNDEILVIRLKDHEQREIFYRLCLDIVSATRKAASEVEAVEIFLARTWRWHRLLRGGRDSRLSDEEQKGLIGELWLMRQHLFPHIGVVASVKAWTGPLDSPKDFEIGRICIEAKARRGAATPFITVSSEHQLDIDGLEVLFLNVLEVSGTSKDDTRGITVTDVARMVLEDIKNEDSSIVDLFDERLLAAGFDWDEDYDDKRWLLGAETLYRVSDDFPRITPKMYHTGVSNVRYSISIRDCEPFQIECAEMTSLFSGDASGNQH